MLLMSLLFSLLQIFWLPILAIVIIVAIEQRKKNKKGDAAVSSDARTQQDINRDRLWNDYIESFKGVAKTDREKKLLDTILGGGKPEDLGTVKAVSADNTEAASTLSAAEESFAFSQARQETPPPAFKQPLDGTLLLLYFGAFLFVASAGLFVAFGGLNGTARTLLVLLTTAVMYWSGFNLYGRNKRLQPAGVAFVAIGMAIAPLVGVAVYHYMASGLRPEVIWFGTSVLCLAMYAYALKKLQTAFISYLFIFSFLSLFESAIAVVDGSVRYYIWGLIVTGMILRVFHFFQESNDLKEASAISAQLIIPLSILVSLYLVTAQGAGQLSISLLLAAVYYSMEAFRDRENLPVLLAASQILYLSALATGVYAITGKGWHVAVALMAAMAAQAVIICVLPAKDVISQNFASLAFLSVLVSVLLGYPNAAVMSAGLGCMVLIGAVIMLKQSRIDALALGSLALVSLPYMVGQGALTPHLQALQQTELSAIPVVLLLAVKRWLHGQKAGSDWQLTGAIVYVGAGILALAPVWQTGGVAGLASSLIFACSLIWIASYAKLTVWWALAGATVCVPILSEFSRLDGRIFSVAVLTALLVNLVITLICRAEFNRWAVAILLLITPVALGAGGFGFKWTAVAFAYAYLASMVALILCRSIARGVLFASSKIPVVSFYRSASLSYVTGFIIAGALSLLISLGVPNSKLHTTLILIFLLATAVVVSLKVEKNKEILSFVPVLAQAILVSAVRADDTKALGNAVVVGSSAIALLSYYSVKSIQDYLGKSAKPVLNTAWGTAFVPILLGMSYTTTAQVLPLLLMVAGALTMYHYWHHPQAEREASGGIIVFALLWLLSSSGLNNFQADAHIIALTCGLYAYWRFRLGDIKNSDAYLGWMFGIATVPLVVQALGGQAGDLYGWWLLLEQVGFMILGISIKRRWLTMWGLYVAVGAVLYQLRHLGWAALSFLAIFIIGLAIRRLLASTEHDKDNK